MKRFKFLAVVGSLTIGWHVGQSHAVQTTLDDFGLPSPANPAGLWVVDAQNPDPYINQTPLANPFGERDLLIDVVGIPNLTSSIGAIGDDGGRTRLSQNAGSTDIVVVTLQYDGVDNPPSESGGLGLTNSEGLGPIDLTDGVNDKLVVDWLTSESGFGTSIQYSVEVHSEGGGSATVTGTHGEDGDDSTIESTELPFNLFAGVDFTKVTSIELRVNDIGMMQAVDYQIDGIRVPRQASVSPAATPEPGAFALAALGLLGLAFWFRPRRKVR